MSRDGLTQAISTDWAHWLGSSSAADGNLSVSQQCAVAANEANGILVHLQEHIQ